MYGLAASVPVVVGSCAKIASSGAEGVARVDLDVVIVTYNSGDLLPDVIGPLPDDVNVIVVDNASRDNSIDVANELGLKVLSEAANTGFAAAANRGAAVGTSEFILFLNPDAVVEATALSNLLREFDDEQVAVVSPRLTRPDGTPLVTQWPFPSSHRAWRDAIGLKSPDTSSEGEFVVGAVFLCRRSAFESVGGFDERFWLYGEETDLCRRLRDDNWTLRLVADVTASHIGKASWKGVRFVAGEHRQRGAEHFIVKHEGRVGLLSYRLARVVDSSLRSVFLRSSPFRDHHRQRLHDTLRAIVRSPMRVPVDSPVTRVPGAGLVVFGLEPWGEGELPMKTEITKLLIDEPERRVLYVEPSFVPTLALARTMRRPRHAGLRPVHADGRVVLFQLVQFGSVASGRVNSWLAGRQIRRAVRLFGLDGPAYVVEDPAFGDVVRSSGVPVVELSTSSVEPKPHCDLPLRERLQHARQPEPSERFRVLYLSHRAELVGNSLAMLRLLAALPNVDAHVILGEHGPLEKRLAAAGIAVECLPVDSSLIVDSAHARLGNRLRGGQLALMRRSVDQITDRVRELEPDLIHTTTMTSAILGALAARRAHVPIVWQVRGNISRSNMSLPALLGFRVASRILPDAILTNSWKTWSTLGLTRRGPTTASQVVGDLVQTVDADAVPHGPRPLTVAIVSRLVPWKGQQVFLDAFARAFAGSDAVALVVGEGVDESYETELRQQVADLGIVGQVRFTGFVDDVPSLLRDVDVLVHASTHPEQFSQTVVEGMAAGLAVVTSQAAETVRMISDGMDGLVFPDSDVASLADCLTRLAADPVMRRRLGEAARRRATIYRPEVVADQVLRTYRQVVTVAENRRAKR